MHWPGTIRDTKSLALAILRLIQEEAAKERTGEVQAIVPVDVSAFLLNEKRSDINEIESGAAYALLLSPAPISTHLTSRYEAERRRSRSVQKNEL